VSGDLTHKQGLYVPAFFDPKEGIEQKKIKGGKR